MRSFGAVFVALASASAMAADPGDEVYKKGMAHFSRGEWKQAVKVLSVAAIKLRTETTRAAAYKHVGLAHVELGKESAAERAFVLALTADPLVDVNPASDPPPVVALFRATRDRLEGTLSVTTNRPDARVFVDGNDRGPVPFSGPIKVGRHQIRVATADGQYERLMDKVVVGVGKTVALALDLEARVGFLVVTGPAGYEVHIDGSPIGRTPVKRAAVAPGKRTVSVMRTGFDTKIIEVDVEAGREAAVDGTLVKTAPAVVATPAVVTTPKTDPPTTTTTTSTTTLTTAAPLKTTSSFETRRNTRPWGWVTLGVSAASLAVGSILFFASSPTSGGSREAINADIDATNLKIEFGATLMIGGGVVGGLSLALFLLHRDSSPARVSFDLSVPTLSGSRVPGFTIAVRR